MSTTPAAVPQPAEVGPPPPFDPECAVVLAELDVTLPPSVTPEMVARMRTDPAVTGPHADDKLRRGGAFTVEERSVPGADGEPDVPLLICRPASAKAAGAALYHMHGGGMVVGGNRRGMSVLLDWAQELQLTVISVQYRLAPETPHPGPVEDCYAGLAWVAAHTAELGIDPARIIVSGISAGGGLAAALSLMTRDRGGPKLAGQMLRCPMLDDRDNTPSALQMAGIGAWDHTFSEFGWTALLGDARGGPDVSPYAAPARATDLSGLPPAFIDVGSAETFRDEAVAYASRIWQAGGVAELHVWPGGFHGYPGMAPHTRLAQETKAAQLRWLRRLLDRR